MFFKVRALEDEARIVSKRLSEPLLSDFGRAKSLERACREACQATRGTQVARGACRVGQVARAPSPSRLRPVG